MQLGFYSNRQKLNCLLYTITLQQQPTHRRNSCGGLKHTAQVLAVSPECTSPAAGPAEQFVSAHLIYFGAAGLNSFQQAI